MNHSCHVYESVSRSIYVNLALEDYLFRTLQPDEYRLLLWQNHPAIVIGRYQNPFLECAVENLKQDGVNFARRQSGGGAVWHDEGNLCFSILGPKKGFDQKANIALICSVLQDMGIPSEYNDKLDIIVQGHKVSGSAFRERADRAFHHGTLLVNADLEQLNSYLTGNTALCNSKGIASRRSLVANLSDYSKQVDINTLKEQIAAAFSRHKTQSIQKLDSERDIPDAAYQEYLEYIRSWEWLYGKSPPFSHRIETDSGIIQLHIKNGIIVAVSSPELQTGSILQKDLAGIRYDHVVNILQNRCKHAEEQNNKKAAELFSRLLYSIQKR